jgi:Fe-S cluster biogenesis protein NfuA
MNNGEFQDRAEAIEKLVERAGAMEDETARSTALELMQALMDLHGAALSRIMEILAESGEKAQSAIAKLGDDPLTCGILVLYGVHPLSLEERVKAAIDKVRPQLRKHNASVELLEIGDAIVRVNIESSGHGCGSSPDAMKRMIEQAIRETAPEVADVIAEGARPSADGFVPLNMIQPSKDKEEKQYEESTA